MWGISPKAEDEVLGDDSRLLLLLPTEEDGDPGMDGSDNDDDVEPPKHNFLLTVRSIALLDSECIPLLVPDRLMQLLFSNKFPLAFSFRFDFFEFKGLFILVVRSTGSI